MCLYVRSQWSNSLDLVHVNMCLYIRRKRSKILGYIHIKMCLYVRSEQSKSLGHVQTVKEPWSCTFWKVSICSQWEVKAPGSCVYVCAMNHSSVLVMYILNMSVCMNWKVTSASKQSCAWCIYIYIHIYIYVYCVCIYIHVWIEWSHVPLSNHARDPKLKRWKCAWMYKHFIAT